MPIKIMTWNIWSGKNWQQVVDFVRKYKIDIMGLQEVDKNLERTGCVDICQEISSALGYYSAYGASIENQTTGKTAGGQFGNAVISRFPIIAQASHSLNPAAEWDGSAQTEPRTLLETTIDIDGQNLRFMTLHLGYSREFHTTPLKIRQMDRVIEIINQSTPPTVLLGDFNALSHNEEMMQLKKYLKDTDENNSLKTWTTYDFSYKDWQVPAGLNFKIDYIFVSKEIKHGTPSIDMNAISDHVPVLLDIFL